MTTLPAMNFQKAPRAFYITPHGNATSRKGYIIDVTEILPASLDQVTGDELIEAAEKLLPPEASKGTKEDIDLFRGLDGYICSKHSRFSGAFNLIHRKQGKDSTVAEWHVPANTWAATTVKVYPGGKFSSAAVENSPNSGPEMEAVELKTPNKLQIRVQEFVYESVPYTWAWPQKGKLCLLEAMVHGKKINKAFFALRNGWVSTCGLFVVEEPHDGWEGNEFRIILATLLTTARREREERIMVTSNNLPLKRSWW